MLKREHIEEDCLAIINRRGSQFGFKFQNIEFNEITLPRDILNAVSASALARRNAEAKLIEAQAEIDSAMMYKQAADEVSSNPISLQLQWLETMKDIAKSTVSTLVLPDTVIGPWDEILAGNGNMK
jgi:regulator of protease activity HflC (stomatin/prohibitin superfamily)